MQRAKGGMTGHITSRQCACRVPARKHGGQPSPLLAWDAQRTPHPPSHAHPLCCTRIKVRKAMVSQSSDQVAQAALPGGLGATTNSELMQKRSCGVEGKTKGLINAAAGRTHARPQSNCKTTECQRYSLRPKPWRKKS